MKNLSSSLILITHSILPIRRLHRQWARRFTVSSLIFIFVRCFNSLSPDYFVKIGLSHEEAADLHLKYYTQYGLALRGLTRHHDIGSVVISFHWAS